MLADVGRDDAVALGERVHLLDHVYGRDGLARAMVAVLIERALAPPL